MADRAVDLPKPHPDDHEDVVDWLSTARALWARGERADALVWLRRAAEAAAMAGQPFRASEIGMYVTALEEKFGDLPGRAEPAAKRQSDRAPQDTLVDSNEAFGALASEVLRSKLTSIEVDIEEDTLIEEEPAGLAAPAPEVASAAPKAPPPALRSQAPMAAHEPKIIVQVASVPPPATSPPVTEPSSQPPAALAGSGSAPPPPAPSVARPASVAPPPSFIPPMVAPRTPDGEEITLVSASLPVGAFRQAASPTVPFGASPLAATPAPPPARVAPTGMPPPPPSFGLPPLAVPPPPPTPTGDGFGLRARRHGAPLPKPPMPSSAPPPPPSSSSSRPAPPSSPPGSAPPPRSPMPSSTGLSVSPSPRRMTGRPSQRVQREPILDPWAEDQIAAPRRPVPPAPKSGTEEVVVVRARMPSIHEEDEVFTSAAPLPVTLRRNPPAAPGAPSVAPQAPVAPPVSVQAVIAPPAPPAASQPAARPAGRLQSTAEVAPKSVPPPAARPAAPAAADSAGEDTVVEPPQPEPTAPTKAPARAATTAPAPEKPTAPAAKAPASVVPPAPSLTKAAPKPTKASAPTVPPPAKGTSSAPAAKAAPSAPPSAKVSSPPTASAASSQPVRIAAPPVAKIAAPPAPSAPRPAAVSVPRPASSGATVRPATVPPPPTTRTASSPAPASPSAASAAPAAPAPAAAKVPAPGPAFDPARATLPMVLEIEPPDRPVDMPSMRPTLPMPIELPKEIEAMFAAVEDDPVMLHGTRLDQVDAFEGLPRASHELLAARAEIVQLAADEEVSGFGGALLVSGGAVLCATIVDAAAHWARFGELLVARGTLAEGVAVRVVGAGDGAIVAVWPRAVLEQALAAHAPCEARARARGDRLQALAGATMGPLGEIDDEHRRALAAELTVRCLAPGEVWLEDGAPAPPIALVGAGEVELYGPISEETSEAVEPGALVFPELAAIGGEAPSSARAGASGALLLVAERDVVTRMVERVPDLAERLRGG